MSLFDWSEPESKPNLFFDPKEFDEEFKSKKFKLIANYGRVTLRVLCQKVIIFDTRSLCYDLCQVICPSLCIS